MTLNELMAVWMIKNPSRKIFDGMKLPEKYTAEYLYRLIMSEYGEMEPLYKDSTTFEAMCKMFWERNTPVYNALENTVDMDYNPIDDSSHTVHRLGKGDNTAHSDARGEGNRAAFNTSNYSPVAETTNVENANGKWGDDITVTTTGLARHSYQDLVEQQRKVANFHTEEYILRDWAKEMMVAIW